jgi:integrase
MPSQLSQPLQPTLPSALIQAGQAANRAAARHRFEDYRSRRAVETLRRQEADLGLFANFLGEMEVPTGDLVTDPEAWRGITWGLVEAFVKWQLQKGYAVPSVNVRLSSVKTYTRLAFQAGTISPTEYALIRAVQGYSQRERRRVDRKRTRTRIGLKKATPVKISLEQAQALKSQPNHPQGRRDALLMCLLLDHGLRVGEVAALSVENLDLTSGMLRFYRSKVGKEQVHRLSPDALKAATAYANYGDLPHSGPLLRRSRKNDHLGMPGMTERGITLRVRVLGERVGLVGLSAHDCRHFWATSAARNGTDPFALQEAGGWSSLAMPRRYVEDQQIANEGVKTEKGASLTEE